MTNLITIPDLSNEFAAQHIPAPPDIRHIPIRDLMVDQKYQREVTISGRRVIERIIMDFKWSRFGIITVAKANTSNKFAVIDGQHRVIAMKAIGQTTVPCLVISESDRIEQAKDFIGINTNKTRVTAAQAFKARLAAEDPEVLDIMRICGETKVNLRIGNANASLKYLPGDTHAISAILKLYRKNKDCLVTVLSLLGNLDTAAQLSPIPPKFITGTFNVLDDPFFGPRLDCEIFVQTLKQTSRLEVEQAVATYRSSSGESEQRGYAVVFYNLTQKSRTSD